MKNFPKDLNEKLDEHSSRSGVRRSELIRIIIEHGLSVLDYYAEQGNPDPKEALFACNPNRKRTLEGFFTEDELKANPKKIGDGDGITEKILYLFRDEDEE